MNLTGGIVLFAVIWFMVFFIALQMRTRSQAEAGSVVPGTPASAPSEFNMERRVMWTTVAAVLLWSVIAAIILSGRITLYDIDWFGRLAPEAPASN